MEQVHASLQFLMPVIYGAGRPSSRSGWVATRGSGHYALFFLPGEGGTAFGAVLAVAARRAVLQLHLAEPAGEVDAALHGILVFSGKVGEALLLVMKLRLKEGDGVLVALHPLGNYLLDGFLRLCRGLAARRLQSDHPLDGLKSAECSGYGKYSLYVDHAAKLQCLRHRDNISFDNVYYL